MIITYKINRPLNNITIHIYSISFKNINLAIENNNLKELNKVLNNIIHYDLEELSNAIESTFHHKFHFGVFKEDDYMYGLTHILSPHTFYKMKW